jgi:hypothetical protein
MRKRILSMGLLAVLALGMAASGSAADGGGGGGGFWEKMSGPGKWAYGYAYVSFCLKGEKVDIEGERQCLFRDAPLWLNVGGSFATAGDEDRPGELVSPDLRVISVESSVDYKLWNWREDTPILVGAGAGLSFFQGDDVDLTRASLELRASGVLFRRKHAYVGVRYTLKAFLGGFTAADFGDSTGTFDEGGVEWVHTFSLFVQLN